MGCCLQNSKLIFYQKTPRIYAYGYPVAKCAGYDGLEDKASSIKRELRRRATDV